MSGGVELTNPERRMLRAMLGAPDAIHSLSQVMSACNWNDQAVAVGAGQGLSDKGLAETQESVRRTIHPGKEGHNAIANGLLEARLWAWISSQEKPTMAKLQAKFERHEAGPGVGLLKKLGVQLDAGTFVCEDSSALKSELQARNMFLASLPADEEDLSERLLAHFKGRKELVEVVEHKSRAWVLTDAGRAFSTDGLQERKQISEITPELLQSGEWKDAEFRSFDVTLESTTPRTGRSHPMQELIERIRRIFLEMGFPNL